MDMEKEKVLRAKEILKAMAGGLNPFTGEEIEDGSFLHDPRLIRCLHFVQEILTATLERPAKAVAARPESFSITSEEKSQIVLPPGKIGVTVFAKAVNGVLDPERSKKLSGLMLNRQLKKMGILGEEELVDGKKRTVLGPQANEHGIESEHRNYNGNEYEMILFNEAGKQFLLENLENIMAIE